MANWIFQGNPDSFYVNESDSNQADSLNDYVKNNKVILWDLRQIYYEKEIAVGDYVFIWRSNGSKPNTGGIIALTKVLKNPYRLDDDSFPIIQLEVLEARLNEEDGMLLRHKLMDMPEVQHLRIIHSPQQTNYKLSENDFNCLYELWQNPSLINLSIVDRYLLLFKQGGVEQFSDHLSYIEDSYSFFQQFKERTFIEQMEWEDFQKIGDHINSFRMGITRARALGKQNHPIERYRNSFIYLLHGDDSLERRMDNFLTDDDYELFGFGFNILTEIIGNVYPEDYCFYNQRDRVAVENELSIDPGYVRGDSAGTKFIKFQQALKDYNIVKKYEEVVGRLTNFPIYYEIDQFFSFIYEQYKKRETNETDSIERRYWLMSAGKNNSLWETFKSKNQISIGWTKLGDLREYNSKEAIINMLKEKYNVENNPTNNGLANYEFAFEMREGDYVFVKHGTQKIIGYGIIMSDYEHSVNNGEHHSFRHVDWLKFGEWDVTDLPLNQKTLTDITPYAQYVDQLLERLQVHEPDESYHYNDSHEEQPVYDLNKIKDKLFMDLQVIEDAIVSLDYKKNIILQGPPGVGKTFIAKRLAYLHMGKKVPENIQMIQFHQSYSYEEFIRGFKPSEEGRFKLEDGIFYQFCQRALNNPEENYYFIIDEINRGNLSKIFGEVMMLIEKDKRGPEYAIQLAYPKENDEPFFIPENVYIIAMMNTADRSLSLVDYALRRRFRFINLVPGFHTEAFENHLKSKGISQGYVDKIRDFMDEVNKEIVADKANLGKGFEIGHSYFTPTEMIDDEVLWYERVIQLEIKPLLEEYWFDQEDKVDDFIEKS